jgi:hypothetical protein
MFTMRANPNREIERGVTTRGIPTPNNSDETTMAAASEAIEVTVEEAKAARHLPAKYGGEDFGDT